MALSSVLGRELARKVYQDTYAEQDLDGYREPMIGFVEENQDPEELGRVKVTITVHGEKFTTHWIQIVMPGAAANRGWFFIPERNDEVLVMFRDGEPVVVGALWGKDKPPETNPTGDPPPRRVIKSRAGSRVLLDDENEKIVIEDGAGKGRITFDAKANKITVEALEGDVCLQAPNGTMAIDVGGDVTLTAKQNIETHSGGAMTFDGKSIDIKASQVSISGLAGTNLCGGMAKHVNSPATVTAEAVPVPYEK